jgi:hypothetical protein
LRCSTTLDPNICSHAVTRRDYHNGASLPDASVRLGKGLAQAATRLRR